MQKVILQQVELDELMSLFAQKLEETKQDIKSYIDERVPEKTGHILEKWIHKNDFIDGLGISASTWQNWADGKGTETFERKVVGNQAYASREDYNRILAKRGEKRERKK